MHDIVHEWWAKDINSLVAACLAAVSKRTLVVDQFPSTSPELGRVYGALWAAHETDLAEDLRTRVAEELGRASMYGTLNHYLDAKFETEALGYVPRVLAKFQADAARVLAEMAEAARAEHDRARRQPHTAFELFDESNSVDAVAEAMARALEANIQEEVGKDTAADLEAHQRTRVFLAVRAYYSVVFKQTVDNVLCLVRDRALAKWKLFVSDTLASEPSVVAACGETGERAARRGEALSTRARVERCEEILRGL